MNIFIRNLFLFVFAFIAFVCVILAASSLYMNSIHYEIDESKNILVIGDSHTECAIDDSAFKRAANYSKSATPFVYSYAALRKLVSDNPQIDTVLLSFHSASLSHARAESWVFGELEMSKQIPVFFPYFNAGDVALFLFKPQFYKAALTAPLTSIDYYLNSRKGSRQVWIDQNIGNFRELSWSNFSRDTAATKPYGNQDRRDTVSQVTMSYLRKFANFCKERQIKLILINTPVYQWKKYGSYEEFNENRQKLLKDFLFLDYADFPIADSCRFDIWHLNQSGAKQFSRYLELNLTNDIKDQNP